MAKSPIAAVTDAAITTATTARVLPAYDGIDFSDESEFAVKTKGKQRNAGLPYEKQFWNLSKAGCGQFWIRLADGGTNGKAITISTARHYTKLANASPDINLGLRYKVQVLTRDDSKRDDKGALLNRFQAGDALISLVKPVTTKKA